VDELDVLTHKISKAMYTETETDPPKSIYINPRTMQVVGKGYPNAIEYVRKENRPAHDWQNDQPHHIDEYNGHADHDLIDNLPTRE
jgi:hypothetical protein